MDTVPESTNKLVVVTGGAGFVGSRLCERLVRDGHKVISLDNYFAGSRAAHVAGVDYREGHTKDIAKHIQETPDIICHLGEYSRVEQSVLEPELVHDLNTVGTEGVLAFWTKHKCKLLYAGSSTKFGDGGATRDTSPYASTKAANTEKVKKLGEEQGLPYAITYFYNVYGPGERAGIYGTVIEAFKQMYIQGAPAPIVSPGTQMRNFTHVDDIVEGLIVVGERGHGDEFGLGNPEPLSILEVAELFGLDTVMLPPRASNRMQSALDTSKSGALGWKPTRLLKDYIYEFVSTHAKGPTREKRVLVFSTTFFPVAGPAEKALYKLIEQLPGVRFDIITSSFVRSQLSLPLPNVRTHDVGFGLSVDKYLLPLLGYRKAVQLSRKHQYLFGWGLMASYASLLGVFIKRRTGLPLLVTVADQDINKRGPLIRGVIKFIFANADQVYGVVGSTWRRSLGVADSFANQLRYAYADILRNLI